MKFCAMQVLKGAGMADWYWYELTENGTVRLLRVFGTSPEVVIPEQIAGRIVTELGAYCFAEKSKCISSEICSEDMSGERAREEFQRLHKQERIRELSGRYLQSVVLPESIVVMGNFCFYQCSLMTELVVGNRLTTIGSDAFMNCLKLQKVTMLGSITSPSGLKQILGQRSLELEVSFETGQGTEAVLLYPEYSETYDEIGPAHIFKLSIEGEGFRARQCFQEGIVDLVQYDGIFQQACAKESVRTLCKMAWLRLYYPVELRRESKEIYEKYLKEHANRLGAFLVEDKNLELLYFVGERGYLGEKEIADCILYAADRNWTEGAGMLLQYQNQWFAKEEKEEYSFDEF